MHPSFGQRDPDARGYYGAYGGRFVPETLMAPVEELRRAQMGAMFHAQDFARCVTGSDLYQTIANLPIADAATASRNLKSASPCLKLRSEQRSRCLSRRKKRTTAGLHRDSISRRR